MTDPVTVQPTDRDWGRLDVLVDEDPIALRDAAWRLATALAAAEHRIARLEAQTDIRGRAIVMYRERAREAEAERDEWRQTALDERGAALDLLEQIKVRNARIKAVRAIHRDLYESLSGVPYCVECDRAWPCPTIRALDGDA